MNYVSLLSMRQISFIKRKISLKLLLFIILISILSYFTLILNIQYNNKDNINILNNEKGTQRDVLKNLNSKDESSRSFHEKMLLEQIDNNIIDPSKNIQNVVDDDEDIIINNNPITSLLSKIIPIIESCEPSIGYELQNEDSSINDNDDNTNSNVKDKKKLRLFRKKLNRIYGKNGKNDIGIHDLTPILSKNFLNDCLYLPDDMFQELKISHEYFVKHIENIEYNDIDNNNGINPLYDNTNGIVFIGGGKFSWLTLLSIENLRSTGSILPIEVMIPTIDDYEYELCENILPDLNAKCILLYEFLPKNLNFKLNGYQYKSLALLISSFQNVLLLDSDNIPILNPDILFNDKLFIDNGMIVWPDFWRRVTHPLYYKIANREISNKRIRYAIDKKTPNDYYTNNDDNDNIDIDNDIPLHDREGSIPDASTESGQLIINKKTHFKALLLSFYYNVYGPRHYYPLFTQGGAGEGDKETFIAATLYYNLKVYQVNRPVGVIGHWVNGEYNGVGMIQFNPIIDKLNEDNYIKFLNEKILNEGTNYNYNFMDYLNYFSNSFAEPMFFHCNFPKIDPISLFNENKLVDENNNQWRLFEDQPNIGFDFELRQWNLINKYFCPIDDKPFNLNYLKNSNINHKQLCNNIKERLDYLLSTEIKYDNN